MFQTFNVARRRYFFIPGWTGTPLAPLGQTGLTINVKICKAGLTSFADPAGGSTNLTEIGNGWYYADFTAGDNDTLGPLNYQLTWGGGSNSYGDQDEIVAFDPYNGHNLGLDYLDVNVTSRSTYAGGAVASVTGNVGGSVAGNVLGSIGGDVLGKVLGGGASTITGTGARADVRAWNGTAPNNLVSGRVDASVGAYASGQDPATLVLDVAASGHSTAGSIGAAIGAAGTLTAGERNSVADALLDRANAIETGLTPRQALRALAAGVGGTVSGAPTATITINGLGVTTQRMTQTFDLNGNRTAVTFNL